MAVRIYHNPRCSKSRRTLELIRDQNVEPEIIDYLKTPLDAETLKDLLRRLGLKPRELLRTKETVYKEVGLDDSALSDDDVIAAMIVNPILIERPIVVNGEKAVLGRPPENVLGIL